MDKATLAALKGSIAKWEAIAAGTGQDRGCGNCQLCQMFVEGRPFDMRCGGCPVMYATGVLGCLSTPYEEFKDLGIGHNSGGYAISDVAKEVARREVAFLKSLLPEGPSMSHNEFGVIRHYLGLSQEALAILLGAGKRTVEHWEQGTRKVPGPAARLMWLLYQHADVLPKLRAITWAD